MTVRYSTNWMGPLSIAWYENNGLTVKVEKFNKFAPDGILKTDEIIEHWACGRIDVYGYNTHYPEEISLPLMRAEDWNRFTKWLAELKTNYVWSLDQIVTEYEKTNPKIQWWDNKGNNNEI